jgi:colanic acid biosynthesis glycosyl transferase WcaI
VPKLLADAGLGFALRKQVRALKPDVIVAHHVEAALTALGQHPLVFFAHTDLGAELPSYLPAALGRVARSGGAGFDRTLVRRADAVAAVSPLLAERIREQREDGAVHYVPMPWPLPDEITEAERIRARHAVGIAPAERVLLYAGNLDGYQGWRTLIAALAELSAKHEQIRLVVGTQNDAEPLVAAARAAGVAERVALRRIDGEAARARLHAAADVAVVPRALAAGLPIKLLDALARGVATAAMPAATGGLALERVASIAQDDSPSAFARAIDVLLEDDARRFELSAAGRRHIAYEHSAGRYLEALDEVVAAARARVGGDEAT